MRVEFNRSLHRDGLLRELDAVVAAARPDRDAPLEVVIDMVRGARHENASEGSYTYGERCVGGPRRTPYSSPSSCVRVLACRTGSRGRGSKTPRRCRRSGLVRE